MERVDATLGIAVLASVALVAGCRAERRYESVCQITAITPVELDAAGETSLVDVQIEWDPCPGDQVQVIRGGADFAKCMARWSSGDLVPAKVLHFWDTRGYWTSEVYELAGCARPFQVDGVGDYTKSRECRDKASHGRADGFDCSLLPEARLAALCPWMKRE